jgi:hypothetical protein
MTEANPTPPIYCVSCGGICPYQEAGAQEAWKAWHRTVPGHTRAGAPPPRFERQPWIWAHCGQAMSGAQNCPAAILPSRVATRVRPTPQKEDRQTVRRGKS